MRALIAVALAAFVILLSPARSPADEVSLEQVPPAVRATIERELGGGRLEEIERETKNGRTVYEVELVRDGKEREVHIAEDGTVLKRDD
ncbi:MAG TPA: PepSY domain-containing protein [Methylomirabilota bacterium]